MYLLGILTYTLDEMLCGKHSRRSVPRVQKIAEHSQRLGAVHRKIIRQLDQIIRQLGLALPFNVKVVAIPCLHIIPARHLSALVY